jgi:hypothetical protein
VKPQQTGQNRTCAPQKPEPLPGHVVIEVKAFWLNVQRLRHILRLDLRVQRNVQ